MPYSRRVVGNQIPFDNTVKPVRLDPTRFVPTALQVVVSLDAVERDDTTRRWRCSSEEDPLNPTAAVVTDDVVENRVVAKRPRDGLALRSFVVSTPWWRSAGVA